MKTQVMILTLLTSLNVLAGGSTTLPKLADAVVECTGDAGLIFFNVFKDKYRGELLNVKEHGSSHTVIKLTEREVIDEALSSNMIEEYKWDKTGLFNTLGIDPRTAFDNLSLTVDATAVDHVFQTRNISGGPLKTEYRSVDQVILSSVAPYKSGENQVKHFLNWTVRQVDSRNYELTLNRIKAGQQKCVRTKQIPNMYFTEGSNSPSMITACAQYVSLSEQEVVDTITTKLSIKDCRLK